MAQYSSLGSDKQYKVDFLVYEGGQSIQPYQQGEHTYNPSLYEAQIHPRMYDMYMRIFEEHVKPEVNCKLFMAFSYMGARKSRWGSWGHLENAEQLNNMAEIKTVAPKFAALLDANTPKNVSAIKFSTPGTKAAQLNNLKVGWKAGRITAAVEGVKDRPVDFRMLKLNGEEKTHFASTFNHGSWVGSLNMSHSESGLYLIQARSGGAVVDQHSIAFP